MTRYARVVSAEIEKWIEKHCAEFEIPRPDLSIGKTQSAEIEIDGKPP